METLYLYAFILGNLSNRIAPDNAFSCAEDIVYTIDQEDPLPGLTYTETARLIAVMTAHESGCQADVENKEGDCGAMQTRGPAKQGYPCPVIRQDRVLGLSLGLRWLKVTEAYCKGPLQVTIAAYASGSCKKALTLGKARCREAFLCL